MSFFEWLFRWFTGGERQYMSSVHCMRDDWLWITITVTLCGGIALGYGIIAYHWLRSARMAKDDDAKTALTQLRNIFVFCGLCGYIFTALRMWWPAWRLLDLTMLVLFFYTWNFAVRSRGFRAIYQRIGEVQMLKEDLANAQRENEEKRFFINALSHDLRAPLNALRLNNELVRVCVQSGESAPLEDAVQAVEQNTQAMVAMLDNLLDFARMQGGCDKTSYSELHLQDIMLSVMRNFHVSAQQHNLYLRAPQHDAIFLTDGLRVERILNNLIGNAIKYTDRGGVTLDFVLTAERVKILVADTGKGIRPEEQESLFREFYQVDNHERNRAKGYGLGLTIARTLARTMGGDVYLERSSPEGSVFVLDLPRKCERVDHQSEFAHSGG
jgi:signal transduction histidine kinase